MNEKFNLKMKPFITAIKVYTKKKEGKDSVLDPLIKQLTKAALKAELEIHLAQKLCSQIL